jgi:phosphatidylserine/phosphatidylglycerophosphate/cardiolipin synthase-like enzyme
VIIVTPWIRLERIKDIGALDRMRAAVARDVEVTVYADRRINLEDERSSAERSKRIFAEVADALSAVGVSLSLVEQVHSKIVIADDRIYCVGSFNWFSAQRNGPHVRAETSLVYRGLELASEINAAKVSLKQRALLAAAKLS